MSRFVKPYDTYDSRELPDGRLQLLAPLWYQSDLLGGRIVKVREGFVNDKESVPWWLPITYVWLAVKRKASRAGGVHDWLFATHKVEDLEVSFELANAVYHEAAALDGNGRIVRWVKWAGVRVGGARAYASGPKRFQVNGNDRRCRREPCPTPAERRAAPAPQSSHTPPPPPEAP